MAGSAGAGLLPEAAKTPVQEAVVTDGQRQTQLLTEAVTSIAKVAQTLAEGKGAEGRGGGALRDLDKI